MIEQDKQLLLKDLCARLPYNVKVKCGREILTLNVNWLQMFQYHLDEIKPYLRPMSSMTDEEKREYHEIDSRAYTCPEECAHVPASDRIDWLNAHYFDYRGLIPMGLALEAKEGMYES